MGVSTGPTLLRPLLDNSKEERDSLLWWANKRVPHSAAEDVCYADVDT